MKLISNLRKRVEDLHSSLESGRMLRDIIAENEAFIIDMNAENQLFEHGENSLGVSIADYMPYTEATKQIKRQKGQPVDRVTLRDEGDFHSSIYVYIGDKELELLAADFKVKDLMRKYGDNILGLTDENKARLIWDIIFFNLEKQIKDKIYGK